MTALQGRNLRPWRHELEGFIPGALRCPSRLADSGGGWLGLYGCGTMGYGMLSPPSAQGGGLADSVRLHRRKCKESGAVIKAASPDGWPLTAAQRTPYTIQSGEKG